MCNDSVQRNQISQDLICRLYKQQNAREDFIKELRNLIYSKSSQEENQKDIINLHKFQKEKYIEKYSHNFSFLEKSLLSVDVEKNNVVDLDNIFLKVKNMFLERIHRGDIKIDSIIDSKFYNVKMNHIYLKIILYHLIGNSIEVCKKSSIINFYIYDLEPYLYISIKDFGFEYNPDLISSLRKVRGDYNLFFSEDFIDTLIKIQEGNIVRDYNFTGGNNVIITIPKF